MSRRNEIVYCDVETTGLIVGHHEPFEIVLKHGEKILRFWLEVDLSKAVPEALRKNRYYERAEEGRRHLVDKKEASWKIAEFTSGRTLAGDNPRFDADMIEALLVSQGLRPAWRHNLLDVPVYAAGSLGFANWTYKDLMDALGVEQREEDQHTALGDVLRCEAIHKAALRLHEDRKVKVSKALERILSGKLVAAEHAPAIAAMWAEAIEAEVRPPTKEKGR